MDKTIRCLGVVLVNIVMLFILTSCGTVFCTKDRGYDVPALTITSNVANADVYINGKYVGTTSSDAYHAFNYFGDEVEVKKITIKKEGYKSKSASPRKLKGVVYLNFFPLPMWNWIWGYFVDINHRKCWRYKNDKFYFELKKK